MSSIGIHSQLVGIDSVLLAKEEQTSMETMPSVSIVSRDPSLLNPAHKRDDPLLIPETDPLVIVRFVVASNNKYPSFCVPSARGALSW